MGRLLVPRAELISTYKGDAYPVLQDCARACSTAEEHCRKMGKAGGHTLAG